MDSEEGDAGGHADADPSEAVKSRWAAHDEDEAGEAAADKHAIDMQDAAKHGFGLVPADAQQPAQEVPVPGSLELGQNVEKAEDETQPDMKKACRAKDDTFDLIKDVGAGTYGLVSKCVACTLRVLQLQTSCHLRQAPECGSA